MAPDIIAGLEAFGDGEFDYITSFAELIKGIITGSGVADKGSIRNAGTRVNKPFMRNDVEVELRQIGLSAIAIAFGKRINNWSVMALRPLGVSSCDKRSGLDLENVFIRLSTLVADHIASSVVSMIDEAIVCDCWDFPHATGLGIWVVIWVVAFAPCNCQLDDIPLESKAFLLTSGHQPVTLGYSHEMRREKQRRERRAKRFW